MKTLSHTSRYYIHGYLSSPKGDKANLFRDTLDVIPIQYRNCEPEDLEISSCIHEIKNAIDSSSNPLIIGSSLGGFLAAKTALDFSLSTLVLLNPAIIPLDVDIQNIKDMPQRILQDMKDPDLFEQKINARIILFIGTNDMVVPNRWGIEFAKAQEAEVYFYHDDHRFSNHLKNLPDMIYNVLS
jgi:predicted esterase YcpF (UPF0227 family)